MAEMATVDESVPPFMLNHHNDDNVSKLIAESIQLSIPCLKDKYVAVIPNAFSDAECKELIHFTENIGYKNALVNLGFGYQETMNEFRNHKKLSIDNEYMANYIFNRLKCVIPNEFNNRRVIDINERLRFLRYSPQQYFGAHYDGMYIRETNGQRSLITIMIYLNDNYNGGEFTFLHPTNQNKTHSIKPETGMVLLFQQNELFHQGSIVLNSTNDNDEKENIFKYCVRSDIMYSKELISESKLNDDNNHIHKSYEVEKQKVYFERKQSVKPIKATKSRPKMNNLIEDSLTTKIIRCWFIESFNKENYKLFPDELYEEIARYCRIIGFLEYNPIELEIFARVSETAERYQDLTEIMTELVKLKSISFKCDHKNGIECTQHILSIEQRDLLSVGFKNVVGAKRASWRTVSGECSNDQNDDEKEHDEESKKMRMYVSHQYIRIIKMELHQICTQMLDLLENYILNKMKHCTYISDNYESLIFYMKTAADYYRYLAEIFQNTPLYKEKAGTYYIDALKLAKDNLKAVHPTLLGCVLNYAVHLHEIERQTDKAYEIAKTSWDDAIESLDAIHDKQYKDATLIMRLLRDNLTLWNSENNENNNGDQ